MVGEEAADQRAEQEADAEHGAEEALVASPLAGVEEVADDGQRAEEEREQHRAEDDEAGALAQRAGAGRATGGQGRAPEWAWGRRRLAYHEYFVALTFRRRHQAVVAVEPPAVPRRWRARRIIW